MESSTKPARNIQSAIPASPRNYIVPVIILVGFLIAAISYRIITINDIMQSRGLLERYEMIAEGRDYDSLIHDRQILSRIRAQSLLDNRRLPTPSEVKASVGDLTQAGELVDELTAQQERFTIFIDVIIAGLTGILVLFLVILFLKRRHRCVH